MLLRGHGTFPDWYIDEQFVIAERVVADDVDLLNFCAQAFRDVDRNRDGVVRLLLHRLRHVEQVLRGREYERAAREDRSLRLGQRPSPRNVEKLGGNGTAELDANVLNEGK